MNPLLLTLVFSYPLVATLVGVLVSALIFDRTQNLNLSRLPIAAALIPQLLLVSKLMPLLIVERTGWNFFIICSATGTLSAVGVGIVYTIFHFFSLVFGSPKPFKEKGWILLTGALLFLSPIIWICMNFLEIFLVYYTDYKWFSVLYSLGGIFTFILYALVPMTSLEKN
jgi:hypothetical protein